VVDGRREAVLGAELVELLLPGADLLGVTEARGQWGQRGRHLGLRGHCTRGSPMQLRGLPRRQGGSGRVGEGSKWAGERSR
jgi:hypothetical protein